MMRRPLLLALVVALGLAPGCATTSKPHLTPAVPIPSLTHEDVVEQWGRLTPEERGTLIALDIFLNQLWERGPGPTVPGMTISERLGLAARVGDPLGVLGCWLLDQLDPGHCERAIR